MFVGHYAAAFLIKGKEPRLSLGTLFLAVQFVDILFFPFVLIGLEHIGFVEGITEVNNFDFYHYPITHGFLATLLWGIITYVVFANVLYKNTSGRKRIGLFAALAVMSHWLLDLIAHIPDLPLIWGDPKFGLGLWNYKLMTFLVESGLVLLGLVFYMLHSERIRKSGGYAATSLALFLILLNYLNYYVLPSEENVVKLTFSALTSYFVLAGIAFLVDTKRR
ncbi:hypothetical protein [Aegicerativicinus sediminis]|uniref:hypothetical protein n=1 Tax=Aegicerativicinus sediminis TaxID=2893202 RepID=UPI001E3F08CD|nr:hypothetical protein [Aegicerativicinus sediminis]